MLRAIRDCHFGEFGVKDLCIHDEILPAIMTDDNRPDLLLYPPVFSTLPLNNIMKKEEIKDTPLLTSSSASENAVVPVESALTTNSEDKALEIPKEIENIDLDAVLKQNKLILFGGVEGILQKMKNDGVNPDVKTFTYLIESIPGNIRAEETLIKTAYAKKVDLDLDFYNMLIKKRAVRGAKKDAKVNFIIILI